MAVDQWRNIESVCQGAKVDLVPMALGKFLSRIVSVKNVRCYKVIHVYIQKKTKQKDKTKPNKQTNKQVNKQTNKQTNKTKQNRIKCIYFVICPVIRTYDWRSGAYF